MTDTTSKYQSPGSRRYGRTRLALLAGSVAVAASAPLLWSAAPAQAADTQIVQNTFTGGVLDARGGRTGNWTEIGTYNKGNGGANQKWTFRWAGNSSYNIQGLQSGRCIDIAHSDTASVGAGLVLWDCNGNASQRWVPESNSDGSVKLRNVKFSALCMSAPFMGRQVTVNWCGSGGDGWWRW